MQLDPPGPPAISALSAPAGVTVERIVDFAEFEVLRATLQAATEWPLPAADYRLLAVVDGSARLEWADGSLGLSEPEATAALVPSASAGALLRNAGTAPCTLLVAMPHIAGAGTMNEPTEPSAVAHTGNAS